MYEVELKVRVEDHKKLFSFFKKKNPKIEELDVEDIYFEHPCWDLIKKEEEIRVRYDKVQGIIYLTYKAPLKKGDRVIREELEIKTRESDLLKILNKLGFNERLRKRKKGWRMIYEDFKIDLVEVKGSIGGVEVNLGFFLEVEILVGEKEKIDKAKDRILNLIKNLPFVGEIENKFYTELIIEKISNENVLR